MQSESKDTTQASKGSNYCMTIPGLMSIQTHDNLVKLYHRYRFDNTPYSPDLAPSDYWLFDYIKQHLDDEKDSNSLLKSLTDRLKKTPKSEFIKTLKNIYKERLELCIEVEGD